MIVNNARSVSEALSFGLHIIRVKGITKPSRVGDVLVSPTPVMTTYSNPMNRVLLSPKRDANPFFHVMEALWMLAGRNDLPWLVRFNSRFASYSDDGGLTQPGAYGYRWRNHFGHDQLTDAILELQVNPDSRRVVITMWDGGARADWEGDGQGQRSSELAQPGDFFNAVGGSADVPCNTHIYFDTIDGRLNMTVCCRSNDIIWGAYGANAVHFSFLLEYMSAMTGLPMGEYRQFSNNFHAYTNVIPADELMILSRDVERHDPYIDIGAGSIKTMVSPPPRQVPLVTNPDTFEAELADFMREDLQHDELCKFENSFFIDVAIPMYRAYINHFKKKDYDGAIDECRFIKADDWRQACVEWLQRRKIKAEQNAKPFSEVVETGSLTGNTTNTIEEDNAFGVELRSRDQ